MSTPALREYAARAFTEAFGEPEQHMTADGILFRWRLGSADGQTIRITIDSPEFPTMAHILISDPIAVVRLSAETCRTESEVEALIRQLKARLRGESSPEEL